MSYSPICQGGTKQVTIAQANVAQSLATERTLVKSVIVVPDDSAVGTVTMGYGGAPLLSQLALSAPPNKWIDLAYIQIKSTSAGDKVNYQIVYGE